ncbi:MAG: hypothetical protein R3D25_04515 [Geminicoccaceae bacterium]
MVAAMMLKNSAVARSVPTTTRARAGRTFISGEPDFMVINSGNYATGKDELRVLAVMSDRPMSEHGIPGPLPKDFGIELGVEGLAAVGWNWWLVHKDTPAEQLDVLRAAMLTAVEDEATRAKINELGFTPLPPDQFNPDFYTENCASVRSQLESGMAAVQWEKEQTR